ncbi:MAG TPA: hypothetical protein VJ600_08950, partial [Holophagaceae bacterium]|nr:hypothetical protein [Holophagaceae bacterium]
MMALVACALTAQIAPQKVDEARRLSQGWRRQAGGRERGFNELTPKDQLEFLIGTARDNHYAPNRDAALILLTQWPYEQGLAKALENNWEGAAALSRLGYTRPPANLAQASGPARPWIRGLGLHLDPQGWRLQVIPAPEFMAAAPGQTGLPAALRTAPIPSVLARLDQLRPGLSRLAQLAGGPEGRLLQTASAGSR